MGRISCRRRAHSYFTEHKRKRRIVEETLIEGASVARIARAHGVNANQVFGWRRLYLSGRLGEQKPTMKLLPVRRADADGHCGSVPISDSGQCLDPNGTAQNKKPAEKPKEASKLSQYAKGGLKAVGGAAAVFVVATNPEIGVAGALIGGIGGSASFVSGTTQIIGTATNTDTKEGTEAVEAYGSPQGLVVGAATGGNQSLAAVATTTGDVAGPEQFEYGRAEEDWDLTGVHAHLSQTWHRSSLRIAAPFPPPAC